MQNIDEVRDILSEVLCLSEERKKLLNTDSGLLCIFGMLNSENSRQPAPLV